MLHIVLSKVKAQIIDLINEQAQRQAAAETVACKPIEHFIHSMNN